MNYQQLPLTEPYIKEAFIINIIEQAFQFALEKHDGQYRKGTKIPYITHPFAVAMILKHYRYSDEVVAAGLLHDTLEDTDATEQDLLKFGPFILDLVRAASELDKSLPWEERKRRTIEELKEKSPDQLAVIVADKLHNIRSVQTDLDEVGEVVWERFNRGKREQSWYYMSLLNAIESRRKEVPIIRKLDAEVRRIFIGTEKLTNAKVDLLFEAVFHLSIETKERLIQENMLDFLTEVKESAEALYRNGSFEPLRPLMDELAARGIQFEMNSDGSFILLAFCHELQYRLGWDQDKLYRHIKRNLSKL
ncbi:HD domain-containing protein [Sporosarcina sp. ACRSL]|uniref:HD domain-containing protein n=1 Tax=Sporosarcina sp. ACRSL TaxID=2918215 RepID=UPI001EF54455|nr:HD domain-containing protein [Sporosarcina sp. ACRSL]MCG7344811.1 HD domain-containing protein [Sporosarcina sp. ACRSL]